MLRRGPRKCLAAHLDVFLIRFAPKGSASHVLQTRRPFAAAGCPKASVRLPHRVRKPSATAPLGPKTLRSHQLRSEDLCQLPPEIRRPRSAVPPAPKNLCDCHSEPEGPLQLLRRTSLPFATRINRLPSCQTDPVRKNFFDFLSFA